MVNRKETTRPWSMRTRERADNASYALNALGLMSSVIGSGSLGISILGATEEALTGNYKEALIMSHFGFFGTGALALGVLTLGTSAYLSRKADLPNNP